MLFLLLFLMGFIYWRALAHQRMQLSDLQPADSAIVLGYQFYDAPNQANRCALGRVEASVALYQKGLVKSIVMTGFQQAPHMRDYAVTLGVPRAAIKIEPLSKNTFENLLYAAKLFPILQQQRLILVSDAYHLQRANWLAAQRFPEAQIQLFPSAANCSHRPLIYFILYETGAVIKNALLGRYFLRTTP